MIGYGDGNPGRPYFGRADGSILFSDGVDTPSRIDPDAVRSLVVQAILVLQDQAYEDRSEGFDKTSATMAWDYVRGFVNESAFAPAGRSR